MDNEVQYLEITGNNLLNKYFKFLYLIKHIFRSCTFHQLLYLNIIKGTFHVFEKRVK